MRLIILGAGGYGRVIADVAEQLQKYREILFLDDTGVSEDIVGKCDDYVRYIDLETEFYPAFGNNELRFGWLERLRSANARLATLIHPSAYISPKAKIYEGTVCLPNSVINSYTEVHSGCIINAGALVDHNCVIKKGVHICLGAIVKANNRIPEYYKLEAGQILERGEMR